MADNSTILEKLDGLVARFEEISTLITDPAVIADQKRYVKLTKEYKELDDLMKARKEYMQLLGNIEEARNILANESDADMREMAKEEIFDKLKELVVDQLGVDDDEVTTEATIQEDLGADSLDLVDLVMAVEEEFDVKIADEDLEGIKTVGDIVDYIAENKD